MAFSLSVPVWANDTQGTPGQVATDFAEVVFAAPWEADLAKQMVAQVQQNPDMFVNEVIASAAIRAIADQFNY